MIMQVTEEQRQVMILALTELKLRRPGWNAFLDDLVDGVLGGRVIRGELERLYADLAQAGAIDSVIDLAPPAGDPPRIRAHWEEP